MRYLLFYEEVFIWFFDRGCIDYRRLFIYR